MSLVVSECDPNPKQEEEEDPKFKLQKKLPYSFPESSNEIELLSVSVDPNPNPKQEEDEDSKFKLQKKLPDSFPESSYEIELLSVSVDPNPNPKQEEEMSLTDQDFEFHHHYSTCQKGVSSLQSRW